MLSAFKNVNRDCHWVIVFSVYINDIFNVSEVFFNVLSADDTSIFSSHKDSQTLVQSINCEMRCS